MFVTVMLRIRSNCVQEMTLCILGKLVQEVLADRLLPREELYAAFC